MGKFGRIARSKKTFIRAKKLKINLIVGVKNNQKNLKEELLDSFAYFNTKVHCEDKIEKSCFISKTYETIPINSRTLAMPENNSWRKLLATAILVTRQNLTNDTIERSLYVTNKKVNPRKACDLITSHWHIENNLHQNLDRAFKEDSDKSYKNPKNKAMLRSIALNIMHHNKVKNFTETVYKNTLKIENILNLKGLIK